MQMKTLSYKLSGVNFHTAWKVWYACSVNETVDKNGLVQDHTEMTWWIWYLNPGRSLSLSLRPMLPSVNLHSGMWKTLISNPQTSSSRQSLLNKQATPEFSSICPNSKTLIYLIFERLIIMKLTTNHFSEETIWEQTWNPQTSFLKCKGIFNLNWS